MAGPFVRSAPGGAGLWQNSGAEAVVDKHIVGNGSLGAALQLRHPPLQRIALVEQGEDCNGNSLLVPAQKGISMASLFAFCKTPQPVALNLFHRASPYDLLVQRIHSLRPSDTLPAFIVL